MTTPTKRWGYTNPDGLLLVIEARDAPPDQTSAWHELPDDVQLGDRLVNGVWTR